jgi:sarcosine oxidase
MMTYDAIVLGTGGVGSAALWQLARRGHRVLGMDRFPGGHDRGSSHGQSRAIRQAYFEHPNYVPLLREAYRLWEELEQEQHESLFSRTGLLEVGPADGIVVPGVLASAQQHGLSVDLLSRAEACRRFPEFSFPDDARIVFERDAGYLRVEACVLAHLRAALAAGASVVYGDAVESWRPAGDAIEVQTASSTYRAARLVITAGPWAASLLGELQLPLRIVRKHLHWYATAPSSYRPEDGCPVYFFELGTAFFYGFPQLDARGVKIAEHTGGQVIDDPLSDPRAVDARDRNRVESFLRRCLPQVTLQPTDHEVCFYTMTPDQHFVVDRHPDHGQVVFACGLSGHGFKFASVLGRILADLAIEGRTDLPIAFLSRAGRWQPSDA